MTTFLDYVNKEINNYYTKMDNIKNRINFNETKNSNSNEDLDENIDENNQNQNHNIRNTINYNKNNNLNINMNYLKNFNNLLNAKSNCILVVKNMISKLNEFNKLCTFVNFNHYLFKDNLDIINIDQYQSLNNNSNTEENKIKTKTEIFNKFNSSIEEFINDFQDVIIKNIQRKFIILNKLLDNIYDESLTILSLKSMLFPLKDKCPICLEGDLKIVLNCGHVCCEICSSKITNCFVCKTKIESKTKMFIL